MKITINKLKQLIKEELEAVEEELEESPVTEELGGLESPEAGYADKEDARIIKSMLQEVLDRSIRIHDALQLLRKRKRLMDP